MLNMYMGEKLYYMDLGYLENSIDRTLLAATKELKYVCCSNYTIRASI